MIPHFPLPYPEEILVSTLARACVMLGWNSQDQKEMANIVGRNPLHYHGLGKFQQALPPNHPLRGKDILGKHTLFPIMAFARSKDEIGKLEGVCMGIKNPERGKKGVFNLSHRVKIMHLNHCPECLKDQRVNVGEGYWLRIHQVPTVTCCPVHKCGLHRTQLQSAILPLPKETAGTKSAEPWEVEHALRCEAILQGLNTTPEEFARRAWKNLSDKGLGKIHGAGRALSTEETHAAALAVEKVWPEVGLDPHHPNFRNLIRNAVEGNRTVVQSRLAVLILGEISPEELRKKAKILDISFPCRNPFSECRDTLSIQKVKRLNTTRWAFACEECGFTYSILVKDLPKNKPGREIPIRIVNRGLVWETQFRKVWDDKTLNNNEVARRCETNLTATHRIAAILGLPARSKTPPEIREGSRPKTKKIAAYRKTWEKALKADPNLGRNAFFLKYATAGRFLQKHDYAWWATHLTKQLSPRNRPRKTTP